MAAIAREEAEDRGPEVSPTALRKRILITNAVSANVGDVALMLALRGALTQSGAAVDVETFKAAAVAPYYSDINFHQSLLEEPEFRSLKSAVARWAYVFRKVRDSDSVYRQYDMIVSAAGGYLNSYYGFELKLLLLVLCKRLLHKPVGIYAQSVGPLGRIDRLRLWFLMKSIDVVMVRDEYSLEVVRSLVPSAKIIAANDAAFLLPYDGRNGQVPQPPEVRRIGISVRSWIHDGRSREQYVNVVLALATRALERGGAVEFVSTCQGIAGYVDDSRLAQEIADLIPRPFRDRVTVDAQGRNVESLIAKVRSFDCVIGTRLHMCIISMLQGVPAFNISYEVKGRECYALMGLSEWSVDYNEDCRAALEAFEQFLSKQREIRAHLDQEVPRQQRRAREAFARFMSILDGDSPPSPVNESFTTPRTIGAIPPKSEGAIVNKSPLPRRLLVSTTAVDRA